MNFKTPPSPEIPTRKENILQALQNILDTMHAGTLEKIERAIITHE
jgi:hypothetical protein